MKFSRMNAGLNRIAITLAITSLMTAAAQGGSFADQTLGAIAPLVLSNPDLSSGNVKGYRVWFENGAWQGDIAEYDVSLDGFLASTVNFSGSTPANSGDEHNWSANIYFGDDAFNWQNRKIVTWNGSAQVPFTFSVDTIGADYMQLIDEIAYEGTESPGTPDATSTILNYIRGDTSNDHPDGDQLRGRVSILGDIIHSTPVYVAAPIGNYTELGYAAWATERLEREARVYVGANDGMLHAFNAEAKEDGGGSEVYAYIPALIAGNLAKLTARPYDHTYFVDGQLTVRDAYFDSDSDWVSVLVGGLGAGGKGYFALDVTDPDLDDQDDPDGTDIKVLWELGDTGDHAGSLGETFGKAVIAKLNDNNWYAVAGNGYNSTTGEASLFIIDIETGAVTKRIDTGETGNNGLSSPTLLDVNGDGEVDYAYAGDLKGNLWKFDLSSGTIANWGVNEWESEPVPLHATTGAQAITQAPEIGAHPIKGFLIYFATGRLFEASDKAAANINTTTTQSMYGVWDSGDKPADPPDYLAQTWDGPKTYTAPGDISETIGIYNPDEPVNWAEHHGWKVDLPAGYRVITPIQLRAGRVKVTATKPAPEDPSAENYIAEAAALDGGSNSTVIYDLNADSALDDKDRFNNTEDPLDPDLDDFFVPMMWKVPNGIMAQVTIARVTNGIDTLFLNYLEPPFVEACIGSCEDGFQGGHIDVDTWHDTTATFAGKSTEHTHEYDKIVGRVFIDFFDLNAASILEDKDAVNGHVEINCVSGDGCAPTSGIDPNEPFVVLVANADFSPGSTMQIGHKTWPVVQYQREIHLALADWDPTDSESVLEDSDNESLIFTWAQIEDEVVDGVPGTISQNFDDLAILSGGLHPTQTGCVKETAYGKDGEAETLASLGGKGRWRNGALTTMLVKASYFSSARALDDVYIQDPNDMITRIVRGDGTEILLEEELNGTAGLQDDETFYGLYAKSGVEQLWESTLFWHFGELYNFATGNGKPCYGDEPNWSDAIRIERASNPLAAAAEELGIDSATYATGESRYDCLIAAENVYTGGEPPEEPVEPPEPTEPAVPQEPNPGDKDYEIGKNKDFDEERFDEDYAAWLLAVENYDDDHAAWEVEYDAWEMERDAWQVTWDAWVLEMDAWDAALEGNAEAINEAKAQCAVDYELDADDWDLILDLIERFQEDYRILSGADPETGNPGDPITMGGGTEGIGPTTGPTFRYGRMSWTDVSPQ